MSQNDFSFFFAAAALSSFFCVVVVVVVLVVEVVVVVVCCSCASVAKCSLAHHRLRSRKHTRIRIIVVFHVVLLVTAQSSVLVFCRKLIHLLNQLLSYGLVFMALEGCDLLSVGADPVQRYFASCVEVVFRTSLYVSFLWVQVRFESDGSMFDSALLSAGQSENSVPIGFCFELQEGMCDRFCKNNESLQGFLPSHVLRSILARILSLLLPSTFR